MVHWSFATELGLLAINVWVVCRLRGCRELHSAKYCAQCCNFYICWRWFYPLLLCMGYQSRRAGFGWRRARGHCWSFWAFLTGMFGGFWCRMACCILIALFHKSRLVAVLPGTRSVCCLGIAVNVRLLASLNFSWHRLAFMCVFHVGFSSRWIPRYFTYFLTGMAVLWRFTVGQMPRRVVNVTCADWVGFALILHCSSQFWCRLRWCWSFQMHVRGQDRMTVLQCHPRMSPWACPVLTGHRQ